jgi:PAS domain S-box-containing protein
MSTGSWTREFFGAITVCDKQGTILEMNEQAIENFANYGGRKLIGSNLLDCHPEPSKSRLKSLMENQQRNIYTIETNGIRKIVIQSPWYEKGVYSGFIEMVTELPEDMPHYVRG